MRHRRLLLAVTLALVVAVVLPFAALAAPGAQAATPIPHALEGFANCTTCHQVGGAGAGAAGGTGMPAGHASFTNAQCTGCHQVAQAPAATATTAPAASPTTAAPEASPTTPAAEATATPVEGKGVAEPTAPAATAAPTLPRTGSVPPQALVLAGTAILGLAVAARRMVSR